jgi:glycosyl transferase family 6
MSVLLVTVVSGEAYARYAKALGESADEFFHPHDKTGFLVLEGREGWPDATMYRYHTLLTHQHRLSRFDHVFLSDADMRFEAPVGKEILAPLVGVEHPGYVGRKPAELPFERNPLSRAHVPVKSGKVYYCGGFVGGETIQMLGLALAIRASINSDDAHGLTARWHDESHLNATFDFHPPDLTLPPSFCYPDDDSGYVSWWPKKYERKLVAVDKRPDERAGR